MSLFDLLKSRFHNPYEYRTPPFVGEPRDRIRLTDPHPGAQQVASPGEMYQPPRLPMGPDELAAPGALEYSDSDVPPPPPRKLSERPRLAAAPAAPAAAAPAAPSELEQSYQRLQSLMDSRNVVKNKGTYNPKTGETGKADFKGRLKDALREGLIAAGQQVGMNGGRADAGTLMAAAGGVAAGAIDPSRNEKRQRLRDIARERQKLGDIMSIEDYKSKQRKAQLDAEGQQTKNANDKIELEYNRIVKNPRYFSVMQQIKDTKQIDEQQAAMLNAEFGTAYTPAFWQSFRERIDPATGKLLTAGEFQRDYTVNTSVSPDLTKKTTGISFGGGEPLAVTQSQGASILGGQVARDQQIALHNSSQEFAADRQNTAARNRVALKNAKPEKKKFWGKTYETPGQAPAPEEVKPAPVKKISRAIVEREAKQNKISFAEAAEQARKQGYTIQ